MKLCCTAVMRVLLVGCGTASRVVRLDTGQTDARVFTPRSGAEPVALGNGEFEEAVAKLARNARPPTRPQEAARRLFEVEARSGSYTYETRSHRITPHGSDEHLSYVGVDTFWGLVVGFKRLMEEADRATSFNELRAAGERYGKLMGRNAARAFAMLAMAAIGNTAPGLAAKVPKLPGSMQAAVQAEMQVGIRLAAVGEVETVAVSSETVTIALAPGAVAMTARGTGDGDARDSGTAAYEESSKAELKDVYRGGKNTPGYPSNFKGVQNGTTRHPVTNKELLEKLREIEPGNWQKVYKDGWVGGDKVSLHYFESPSGQVFNFKVKPGWSNQ